MSQTPKKSGEFDLDEDLFDFAGAVPPADPLDSDEDLEEVFASFREEQGAEELLPGPAAETPAPSKAAAPSAPATNAPARPAEHKPAPVPEKPRGKAETHRSKAEAKASEPAPKAEPAHTLTPAGPLARSSKGVLAIALAVTVLNSAVAFVMLGGRKAPELPQDHERAPEHSPDDHDAHAAPPRPSAELPDPEGVEAVHAHPTLDEARSQIARGEYAAARQRVYGLLAIIDRLEDPRRSALEADCQYLIAQSLHLEALARMGAAR